MEGPGAEEIRSWMVDYLAELLGMAPEEVDTSTSFEVYGLDSTAGVGMSGDLSEWLGLKLDADLALEFPTIDALAGHLAELLRDRGSAA
jgi:acyl carrier protein